MSLLDKIILPMESIKRKLPVNFREADFDLFKAELNKQLDEVVPCNFYDASVYASGVCTVKGDILFDVYFNSQTLGFLSKFKLYVKLAIDYSRVNDLIELDSAILVTDYMSFGFFHWFADVLQKIEWIDMQTDIEPKLTIIIPARYHQSYIEESLRPYNFNFNFIIGEKSTRFFVKRLLNLSQVAPTGNYRRQLMCNIRTRFNAFYGIKNVNKRVYITRSKAIKRKIVNENDIMPLLSKYGFTVVAMEDLSFFEQYSLVAQSEILVSLHGAGLTHMLWMKEHCKVMEIRLNSDSHNNCYFSLASELGLEYFYSLAEKENVKLSTQETDFIIDIPDFELALKKIVEH